MLCVLSGDVSMSSCRCVQIQWLYVVCTEWRCEYVGCVVVSRYSSCMMCVLSGDVSMSSVLLCPDTAAV